MNLSLVFDYNINDIKNIEKEMINNKWIENKNITPNEFLDLYLYKDSKFDYLYGSIKLLKYVSPDSKIREASNNFELNIKEYFLNFFKSSSNYKIFLILKKIKNTNDKNNTKKLIKNIFKRFELNGAHLDDKDKFVEIDKKIINYENSFSLNIINDIKEIKYKKNELQGIPSNILLNHKKDNNYIFNTTYPDHNMIMQYCDNPLSRKRMNNTFNSVAVKNLSILKNIINLRTERSKIFKFKNSLDYYFSENRLATEKKINNLLDKLIPILKKKAKIEYKNLLNISNKLELNDYDITYYSNLYKKYLDINNEIIRKYFRSNYSIPKILDIYGDLFNIDIKLIKENPSKYWSENVDLYIVNDKENNEIMGYFYLDLYPRVGKFTHAATFEIQNTYLDKNNKRIIPVTAIVCNFSLPDKDKDYSLFTFNEIVTFCHEFGHAMNNILSKVKYEQLSGISAEHDFGEMPSQFFENWCYNRDFLKKITCDKIPDKIIDNIQKNKNYNGLHYLRQILFIKYDLNVHKKHVNKKYLHDEWFNICNELFPFKFSKNTYPMCRFDHIIGYECGYYGYLWSVIYSYNAFSLFEKDIFNKKLGLRFRKEILEKGGTVKGTKMLKNFLKGNLKNKYFFDIFNTFVIKPKKK